MKKKIINILIIIISFVLIYGAISINEMTIRESQERILDEQYNKKEEVIEEEVMLEIASLIPAIFAVAGAASKANTTNLKSFDE